MPLVDLEDPWTFGAVITVTNIVLFSVIEEVLFDGDVLGAAIQGLIVGLVLSLFMHYAE